MNPLHSPDVINSYFIEQIKDYAIFATDTNGIVCAWNKGAERIKGYKEEEIVGQFYGILHPDEYQEAGMPEKELQLALENGSFENEDWRKRKDGSLFWASVTLTPIYSPDGKHVGFTKITGNITKQKELQDKLADRQERLLEVKNEELKKTNDDLENFIYTASHDLRAPITNIEALVNLLKKRISVSKEIEPGIDEILTRVIDSVRRLNRTIEDLTLIGKLQYEMQEAQQVEIVNIKAVYDDLVEDVINSSPHKPCFLKTDFKVFEVKFSNKNFRSILFNLLINAVKYQSPERPCIVEVETYLEGQYVVLSIKDNGIGISEKHQKQLFTMFKRFHSHVEGSGVGLFMVKKIIENAGGKITVNSREDVGSEFKVFFPAGL